jgi:hypothetical protein
MASRHFVHRFQLHLLDFRQSLPLSGYQVIHLFVEVPDFKFGLEVDAIVALRPHAIFHLLPLLAHHDDRRLLPNGRKLLTLRDAALYITKLPKAEHDASEWQAAMQALVLKPG